jgi:DNA-binding XRE family transcriptional regulator
MPLQPLRIGKLLQLYRWKNDLTLDQLAQEISIDKSTLSRLEMGTHRPNYITMLKLLCWLFSLYKVEERKESE